MRNKIITSLAVVALLGVTACSTAGEASEPAPAITPPSAPAVTVETLEPAPVEPVPEPTTEAPAPVEDMLLAYGDTFEYEDGITVTVKAVGSMIASDAAAGQVPGGPIQLFEVTIMNNSEGIYDPTMVYSTVNVDGAVAERVFDYPDLPSTLDGNVLPGDSIAEVQGFALPTDVTIDVLFSISPSFEHEEALFYGSLGPVS